MSDGRKQPGEAPHQGPSDASSESFPPIPPHGEFHHEETEDSSAGYDVRGWVILLGGLLIISVGISGAFVAAAPLEDLGDDETADEPEAPEPPTMVPQATPTNPDREPVDSDGDGLTDASEEFYYGTNPQKVDTDGDNIPDGVEVARQTNGGARLPGADPLVKDIYVVVDYNPDVERLSYPERQDIRRSFAEMPVENPDGSTGIRVHLVDGQQLDQRLRLNDTFAEGGGPELYNPSLMGNRSCIYHRAVLVDIEDGQAAGIADTPGYLLTVDGYQRRPIADGQFTERSYVFVHELLHNVVGRMEPGEGVQSFDTGHTESGYLRPSFGTNPETYLSDPPATKLNQSGFASGNPVRTASCMEGGNRTR